MGTTRLSVIQNTIRIRLLKLECSVKGIYTSLRIILSRFVRTGISVYVYMYIYMYIIVCIRCSGNRSSVDGETPAEIIQTYDALTAGK